MCIARDEPPVQLDAYRRLIADVYELAGASRRTSELMAAEVGQTAAQWHVLSALLDQPATVAAAARRLGLTRQSVQRVVDGLGVDGMVVRRRNPAHRRAALIAVTPEGREVCQRLFDRSAADRRALLRRAGVVAAELDAARDTLGRLLAAFDEEPRPGPAASDRASFRASDPAGPNQ